MKKLLHWLAHLCGTNEVQIVSCVEDHGIYIGCYCLGCGELSSVHKVEGLGHELRILEVAQPPATEKFK